MLLLSKILLLNTRIANINSQMSPFNVFLVCLSNTHVIDLLWTHGLVRGRVLGKQSRQTETTAQKLSIHYRQMTSSVPLLLSGKNKSEITKQIWIKTLKVTECECEFSFYILFVIMWDKELTHDVFQSLLQEQHNLLIGHDFLFLLQLSQASIKPTVKNMFVKD